MDLLEEERYWSAFLVQRLADLCPSQPWMGAERIVETRYERMSESKIGLACPSDWVATLQRTSVMCEGGSDYVAEYSHDERIEVY